MTRETVGVRFRRFTGFGLGAVPFVMVLGLAYLMATLPDAFRALADLGVDKTWARPVTEWLDDTAASWKQVLEEPAVEVLLLRGALLAVPLLWAASLVRSALVATPRPVVVMVGASLLALLVLPTIGWVCAAVAAICRFGFYVLDRIAALIAWLNPVLLVIGWIVVGLLALAAIFAVGAVVYTIVMYVHENRLWATAVAVVAVLAALGLVVRLGLLDGAFAWIAGVVVAVASWLLLVIGWLVAFAAFVMLFLLVAGAVIAVVGQVGHMLYSQVSSATKAGRKQAACIDLAAGTGVTMSLFLCAAVVDDGFGEKLREAWRTTPLVDHISELSTTYEFLMTGAVERVVRPAFTDYSSTVGAALFVMVAAIGILVLLFQEHVWEQSREARLARPVFLGVGLAVAFAIPLFLLALLFYATQRDS